MDTIFADFNNNDKYGRIRLNTNGALRDIKSRNIELIDGKRVLLDDSDELRIIGVLRFSNDEGIWVAEINPDDYVYY
jgi:hypothetical protein